MKKLFLIALAFAFMVSVSAQSCLQDVWMSLQNKKIMEAKKKIDECMIGNEGSANAWLYKGNVYLKVYNQDEERRAKNPAYVSKVPDAIWIAYESFYKSIELNPKLGNDGGLIDPREGQILCGGPIYDMGTTAMKAKDYETAEKYLTAAIKCFSLEPSYKKYIGYIYYDLANIALETKGVEAQKAVYDEAMNANTDLVNIYLMAYNIYNGEKNLEKCGQIISKAKKNVTGEALTNIYLLDLGYLAMTGDSVKMEKTLKHICKYDTMPEFMAEAANYLIEANNFAKAEELLNLALEKNPNSFNLNNMMAYNFYMQANQYITLQNQAVKERNFDLVNEYKAQKDAKLAIAHDWCEKAYKITPKHLQNARMLKQLKLQLNKEVPAEVNAIIEELTPAQN